jgi:diguanylate cyclase (GGDEF)-like protein
MPPEDSDTAVGEATSPSAEGADRFIVLHYPDSSRIGRAIDLEGTFLRIGRQESKNDLVIADETVSGEHARVERIGANWMLSDVGSKNRTFVNEREVTGSVILRTQDRVRFGSVILKYLSGADIESQMHDAIYHLALHDALTDVHNRRHYYDELQTEIVRAKRHGRPFCVAMVDIDHFKRINDAYGHPAGDTVLRSVAKLLESRLRTGDELGRIGGEEFALLLPETTLPGATLLCNELRTAVEASKMTHAHHTIRATISIGIAEWSQADTDHEGLMKRCDLRLYDAKANGRNRVER